ncbi:MAG: hypothetical protein IPK91_09735 [Saprospiraceae bacterium]|nr:hypothetical protein [Saprospiraceae bacterium]
MKAIDCFNLGIAIVIIIGFTNVSGWSQPDWKIDASSFEYNMNVIGVGYIECDEIRDSNDMIAAFVGDELRGVQYFNVESNQRMYVYMFIYSNRYSGDTIQFKMYDASRDSIYEVSSIVVFSDNSILGSEHAPKEFITGYQTLQVEPVTNILLRQSNAGDHVTKFMVKNVYGQELSASFEWIHDAAGMDNHYFEFVGQDLYIRERIVNFPLNEISIHFKVSVPGSCEKSQIVQFNINDLTSSEYNLEQISIEVLPNPVVEFFQVKSNTTFDQLYLLNPIHGSLQEIELSKQIDVSSFAQGINYLVFKKGARFWKKSLLIVPK